jgi:hypothetical protein
MVTGLPQSHAAHPAADAAQAIVKGVEVADSSAGKEILLRIDGHYTFRTIQTPEGKVYIDVQGAKIGTKRLAGFHSIEYTDANGHPVVRVEILSPSQQPLKVTQESSGLRLQFAPAGQPPSSNPNSVAQSAVASGGATKEALLVSDVSVTQESGGRVTIEILTTGPAQFHVLRFDHPDRLVMDLQGARNGLHRNLIPVSSPLVKDVRVGQFRDKDSEVVRVVADLSGHSVFEPQAFAGGVRIQVRPLEAASGANGAAPGPKLETPKGRDSTRPLQQSARAGGGPESARGEVPNEPAANRLSRNSNSVTSPELKKTDNTQRESPQTLPVLDDILRLLFGSDTPAPGAAASPAKQTALPPSTRPARPALVSDVSVKPGSAGEITIDVALTTSLPFKASRFDRPDRFVVDVQGARARFPGKSIQVDSQAVKNVRVSQFQGENPGVVRIVVDLSDNPRCDAYAYASGVRIEVKPRGLGADASGKTR